MTFAQPWWLLMLALAPVFFGLRLWRDAAQKRRLAGISSRELTARLLVGYSPAARWTRFLLLWLGFICFVLAMARPLLGYTERETAGRGRNILIAVDTSHSMLARDLRPDRMTLAKAAAEELIRQFPDDRIGLIPFAGSAFLQVPLTLDHEAAVETVAQLDTEIIPLGGTDIAAALSLALETFREAESESNALILISDGEEHDGKPEAAARELRSEGIMVVALGVGTIQGGFVPDPADPSRMLLDRSGEMVRSRLRAEGLQMIANQTAGIYSPLTNTGATSEVARRALLQMDQSNLDQRSRRRPVERYRWPLAAGLFSLLAGLCLRPAGASMGPASAAAVLLLTVGLGAPVEGADFGERDYRAGNYAGAMERYGAALETLQDDSAVGEVRYRERMGIVERLWRRAAGRPLPEERFQLHFGMGSAAYRSEEYDLAVEQFGQALLGKERAVQKESHYNLGNSLYRRGEFALRQEEPDLVAVLDDWRDAVSHFEGALALDATHANAQFNRDFVRKRLEELERLAQMMRQMQQMRQPAPGAEGDEPQPQGSDGSEQDGEGQPGEQQRASGGDQEGEGEGRPNDPMEDEGFGDDGEEREGRLRAEEDERDAREGADGDEEGDRQGAGQGDERDPETGFSRSQARQMLRNFSDEDLGVRLLERGNLRENSKNW
ncbi:MAG TPA: VWA domain-containing protein [Verrucomicrobiales bacterium]|nr:VWA domain-containing protein [Verrucomicrobiales bacterium]